MKICLFTASFLPKVAGMEIVIDRLAREFIALGHEVVVLSKKPRGMTSPPHFDYPVYYYNRSMSEVWFLGAPKRMLRRLHRQYHFDVIHAHQIYPTGYLGWRLAAKLRIPTVMTSHVGDVRDNSRLRNKPVTNRRMIAAMLHGGAVTGVGTGICETIFRMTGRDCAYYIGNGADVLTETPACPESLRAKLPDGGEWPARSYNLSVCRLHPNKGLELLIQAYGRLKTRGVPVAPLLMGGAGKLESELRKAIAEAGLENQVFLIGRLDAAERDYLMWNANIFCQPSRVEGMPMTVLEAMAARCAVLGSDIPGIRELLRDRVNGRLVPSEDAAALAAALAEMSAPGAAADLERYREAAAATAHENSWRQVAERYLALFQQAIERGRVEPEQWNWEV